MPGVPGVKALARVASTAANWHTTSEISKRVSRILPALDQHLATARRLFLLRRRKDWRAYPGLDLWRGFHISEGGACGLWLLVPPCSPFR